MSKVPRNSLCPCGAGKKYKKCCGNPVRTHSGSLDFFETPSGRRVLEAGVEMMNPPEPPRMVSRPQIQTIIKDQRARAVREKIYFRPLEETFQDFQLNLLLWTLGKPWFDAEMLKPPDERHVILKWRAERNDIVNKYRKPNADPNEPVSVPLTGNVKALQVLADDVYQLEHALQTPKKITQRLGNMREFQGARYEILVASLLARCGFDIEFVDDTAKKNPEFFATKAGERIAVEAKSRHRPGVLHQSGQPLAEPATGRARIRGLFQEALQQNPGGIPFLVFIDVNLPLTPQLPPMERSWVKEAMRCFEDRRRDGLAESDSGLILTNFGWHYHRETTHPDESMTVKPEHPQFPLTSETWTLLERALGEYGLVIDEENPPKRPVKRRTTTPGWFRYGYFVKGPRNSVRSAGDSFARTPDIYRKGASLGIKGGVEGIVVAVVRAERPESHSFDVLVVVEDRLAN